MRRAAPLLWLLALALGACAAAPGPARSLTAERDALRGAAGPAELRDLGWADLALGDGAAGEAALRRAQDAGARDARTRLGLALRAHDTVDLTGARAAWLALLEEHDRRDPFAAAAAEAAAQRLLALVSEPAGDRAAEDRYLDRLRSLWPRRGRLPTEAQQHLGALLGQLLRLRGREREAAAVDVDRGCPQALWVSGPHGHLPRLDLARPFAPDDPARDAGRGAYGRREVRGCELALEGPPGRPGVIYAVTWVRAPGGALPLTIETGGEPFALYVDGQLRHRELEPQRRRLLEIDLPAGWHALSFKVSLPGGRATLQLALPGVEFYRGAGAAGAPSMLAEVPPVTGGVDAGRVRLRALSPLPPPERLRGRGERAVRALLLAQQAYLEGDVDAGLRAVAAAEAPRLASLRLLEAALLAEDGGRPPRIVRDRVRRALTEALEGDAALLRARIQLASLDLQDERPEPALQLLDARPTAQRRSWPALLLRHRILRSREWLYEAEAALREAVALGPAACAPLEALAELRDALKDDRGSLAASRAVVACNPYSERLAEGLRGAGDLPGARAEYERLLRLQPESEGWLASLAELQLALSDLPAARRSFQALGRRYPRTASYHVKLANLALDEARRAGRSAGPGSAARAAAEAALREGLKAAPASQELHRALLALGVEPPMTPDRVDGMGVIREYAGRKVPAGPRDAAVIVLDRTVIRVFPGGARWTLTHNIMQVLSKDGIDKFGEVSIPDGAEVLTLRTVKADGSTREPEEIAEKESVSAPDLEIGDFVEFEYIDRDEAPAAFPGGFLSERFYFASADAPLDRTELVLVAPAELPLQLDLRGPAGEGAPEARSERRGDLRVLTWARRGVPRVQPEPPLADGLIAEWIPSARPASGVSLERWRDYLRDRFALGLRPNDELREVAKTAGAAAPGSTDGPEALSRRARALDAWVRRNIKVGGDLDDVATMALARREGNPHVVLLALLRAARIPAELWLVRPVASPRLDGPLPPTELYSEALVAVGPPGRPILWLNPAYRHAPSGFVRPQLRGGQALRLGVIGELGGEPGGAPGAPAAAPVLATVDLLPDGGLPAGTAQPGRAARRDDRHVELSMTLLADGSGEVTVRERLQGWPALEWREELERLPEDKVRKELEQRSLGFFFPGASLTGLKYGPLDDDEAPLLIEYSFSAPRLARRRAGAAGAELVLPAPYPALLSRRYVGVPRRQSPLLLSYVVPMVLEAKVQLPQGAGPAQPRPELRLSTFGRFFQRVDASAGRVALRAEFAMPTRRVEPAEYADFVAYARRVDSAEDAAAVIPLGPPSR